MQDGDADQALADRRLLLRYICEDLAARGREVALPVGCDAPDDWLLDALHAGRLVRAAQLGGRLDLPALCSSATDPAALRRLKVRGAGASGAGGGAGAGGADGDDSAGGVRTEAVGAGLLALRAPAALPALSDHAAAQLAYLSFVSAARGAAPPPGLLAGLRAALGVTEAAGADLAAAAAAAAAAGAPLGLPSLDAHVALLAAARPAAFAHYKSFAGWRRATSALVRAALEHAAATAWAGGGAAAAGAPDAAARALLARLAGALRRLDASADEFDEAEYAEAAGGAAAAARALARSCRRGGELPWPARARLAELLLRGVFDPLDDGAYAEDADALLALLQERAWPALGVGPRAHAALLAWAHVRQYAAAEAPRPARWLAATRDVVAGADWGAGGGGGGEGDAASAAGKKGGDAAQDAFAAEVLAAISGEAFRRLADHVLLAPDPGELAALVALAAAAEAARGRPAAATRAALEAAAAAAAAAAFARRAGELRAAVGEGADLVALLATEAADALRAARADAAPAFAPAAPGAAAAAAAALHAAYGARFLPWLVAVAALNAPTVAVARAAMAVEAELLAAAGAAAGGALGSTGAAAGDEAGGSPSARAPEPWGVVERLQPLLYSWASTQLEQLASWSARLLASEDWAPGGGRRGAPARSAPELARAAGDCLDALFGMGLAPPPGVVRCLVEGVDGVLARYCEAAAGGFRAAADALAPPAPPLTRYKKEAADAAEAWLTRADSGAAGAGRARLAAGLAAALAAPWLPPPPPAAKLVLEASYEQLAARANAAEHARRAAAGLAAQVLERFAAADDDAAAGGAATTHPAAHRDAHRDGAAAAAAGGWAGGMFAGAGAAAATAVDALLHAMAMKFFCADLRVPLFEDVYRFRVAGARLERALAEADAALGRLCESLLAPALAPALAGRWCAAAAAALAHVLLDGGPHRLFLQSDAPALAEDLGQLKALFFADGAGLDPDVIQGLCALPSEIVELMALDTGVLTARLLAARRTPLGGVPRAAGGGGAAGDPEALLRVLCHRADHAASKFLKKELKVGKRLPSTFTASPSRAFSGR